MELKEVGEEIITQRASSWEDRDAELLAEYCMALKERQRLHLLLKDATGDAERSTTDRAASRAQYQKYLHVAPWLYFGILAFIGLAEFPLNSVVFQLFGEAQTYTLIASLSLGLTIPFGAHFLGGMLRHGFMDNGRWSIHTTLIVLLTLVSVGVIVSIAYFREKFFEGSGVGSLLGIEMDPTAVTLAFVSINLLLFVVATVAAYVEHNPQANTWRSKMVDANKLYRTSTRRVRIVERLQARNEDRLSTAESEREKAFLAAMHEIKEIRDWMQRIMSVYRTHNLRTRSEPTMPVSFCRFPPIDCPVNLDPTQATLNWDCGRGARLRGTGPQETAGRDAEVTDAQN
jgi:hypothetical protein